MLATSANGNGLFAGNPYDLGISGGFLPPAGRRLLRQADLVIAVGASLNMWTTRHGALIGPDARVIQVDRELDAIGAHRPVDLGIVADAAQAGSDLVAALQDRGHRSTGFRSPEIEKEIACGRWRDEPYDDAGDGSNIDPRTLSIALDELLPTERTVAIDSGHFMGWPAMYLDVPDPAGFVFTQSFQSIGLGLASAIGAAVARPDRLTVAALGDGGALMARASWRPSAGSGCRCSSSSTTTRPTAPRSTTSVRRASRSTWSASVTPTSPPSAGPSAPTPRRSAGRGSRCGRGLAQIETARRPMVVDAKVSPAWSAEWLQEAFRAH